MYISLDECILIAKEFKTRSNFAKRASKYYSVARKNGWLDQVCEHMRTVISLEECTLKAKEFKSRSDFAKRASKYYRVAKKNGWLDQVCKYTRKYTRNSKWEPKYTLEYCKKIAKQYYELADKAINSPKVILTNRKILIITPRY